jgi:hypothetical protein
LFSFFFIMSIFKMFINELISYHIANIRIIFYIAIK